jgi:DNA repair protein RAD5
MLRRTRNHQVDNQPIVSLPPRTVMVQYGEFSPEEKEFYDQLWQRSKKQFNQYLRNGCVLENYCHILEILLRFPFLIFRSLFVCLFLIDPLNKRY